MWWEIQTEKDFVLAKSQKEGFIVITDDTRKKIHRTSCPYIKETNFVQKVITNGNKNGKYFYTYSFATAEEKWKAERCQRCM